MSQKPERASRADEISGYDIRRAKWHAVAVRAGIPPPRSARKTPGTSIATMACIARSALAAPAAKLTSRRISKQVRPRVPLRTRKTTSPRGERRESHRRRDRDRPRARPRRARARIPRVHLAEVNVRAPFDLARLTSDPSSLIPSLVQARALASGKPAVGSKPRGALAVVASVVTIEHEGKEYEVECDGFDSILEAAIDAGIENLSYDCLMGVCMTCPSKVTAGEIDQNGAMLSDDVADKGFALLCCATPMGDGVKIQTVTEEELLDVQLVA